MGCIQSKKDLNDINPNIFRVINIDDDNIDLSSGQLEISRLEITLYRKDKEPTKWPLKCLRRYGYDADVFSFEAGRRGPNGQGIYAFRCRRAETLFHTLQNYIQHRPDENTDRFSIPINTNGPAVANRNITQNTQLRPNGIVNQFNLQTDNYINNLNINGTNQSADTLITDGNYLEPMPNRLISNTCFSSGIRLNSISSGPLSPDLISPSSPSSITNILEATPLNSLPSKSNNFGVSNLYQDIPLREHNNNKPSLDIPPIEHAPTEPLTKMNISLNLEKQFSPSKQFQKFTGSPNDDNLEGIPMYMNITPGEFQPNNKTSNIIATTPSMTDANSPQLATPSLSSTIFGFNRLSLLSSDPNRCYENLDPVEFKPLLLRNRFTKPDIFTTSEFLPGADNVEPCSPTNSSRKVNYIVLDLDQQSNLNSSHMLPNNLSNGHLSNISNIVTNNVSNMNVPSSHCMIPPESPKKASMGYATIDFNKTVALSNSTTPSSEHDSEGSRKTRHNSTAAAPKTRHSNSISD